MNFLNVGPWELTVILIIAILLIGPKRVLEVVQSIRRLAGQLRNMSGEFTSLLQAETYTTRQEDLDTTGSQDEPQDTRYETIEDLKDVVREGLAPIIDIQTEIKATAQETRQTLESIVEDELVRPIAGIQAEIQATAQETRQALEGSVQEGMEPIADIQAELQDAAQETSQALEGSVQEGTRSIADIQTELQATPQETSQAVRDTAESESKPKEGQNEASDKDTTN